MMVFIVLRPCAWEGVEVLGVFSSIEKANDAAKVSARGSWSLFEREINTPASAETCDLPSGYVE